MELRGDLWFCKRCRDNFEITTNRAESSSHGNTKKLADEEDRPPNALCHLCMDAPDFDIDILDAQGVQAFYDLQGIEEREYIPHKPCKMCDLLLQHKIQKCDCYAETNKSLAKIMAETNTSIENFIRESKIIDQQSDEASGPITKEEGVRQGEAFYEWLQIFPENVIESNEIALVKAVLETLKTPSEEERKQKKK